MNLKLAWLIGLASLSNATLAFDEFDDSFEALPVITSASRLSQSVLKSPSSVTVIDSDMIEASGFIDLADVMRLVPGFIVAHTVHGAYSVISHGEGWEYPNRMQIMIDGRSTYTSAFSGIAWNALGIHLEDIDRIEVVRGPAASAYGSNSYSGAINIITKKPNLDHTLQLRARSGNNGEKELLLRHSGQFKDLNYRISASTRENEGIVKYRDTRDLNKLNLSSQWLVNSKNTLWFDFTSTQGDVERANLLPTIERGFYDSERDIDAWSVNFKWDHHFSDSQQLDIQVFHNYLQEDDLALSYPLSEVFSEVLSLPITPAVFEFLTGEPNQQVMAGERTYKTHRTDFEIQYSEIFQSGMQYVAGLGLRYDRMSSEAFFPQDGTQSNLGIRLYNNVQLPINNLLTANVGGLYETNQTERPHFSPRASLNIHLTPQQSIRLGYSQAYRIPSLLEENANAGFYTLGGTLLEQTYTTTDDIKAERVTSLDISYLGRLRQYPLSWEFRAYREEYDDTIYFYDDHDDDDLVDNEVGRIGNAGHSTMYGFEGEIMYRPEKTSFLKLHFNFGHISGEYLTDVNREPPDSPSQSFDLSVFAPKAVIGVLAAKQFGSWQIGAGFYHVDTMKWISAGDTVRRYDRVDASISKTVAIGNKQSLIFKLAGQNLNKQDIFEFADNKNLHLEFTPRYYGSITLLHD